MKSSLQLKILFAEDNPLDAELAQRELKREGVEFSYIVVETENAFRKALDEFTPDIIISDYTMPTFDGMSALNITRSYNKSIPFIILTGSINEETAVMCMKAGANDYVLKEQIKRLPFSVKEIIEKQKARVEKTKIEGQLRESEAKYRSYIDNSPSGVFVTDEKGNYLEVNRAATIITGYSKNELLKMNISDLKDFDHTGRSADENFVDLIKTGKMSTQFPFRRKDGMICWWKIDAVKIGENRMLGFTTDITQLKETESRLMSALEKAQESDRLKSTFLANMSHEIRTPMNGILGFSGLLNKNDLSSDKQQEYIKIIQHSGKRMLNTINDLIDISRIESGQTKITKKLINFNEQLDHLYHFFKPEADAKDLEFHFNPSLENNKAILMTDEEKFFAIMSNYLKNALKYTDEGSIHFGYELLDGIIEFYVKDSGIGILKDKHEAIFERFVQADLSITKPYEGSGLGLAISKAFAEMIGGEVRVDSEFGKGSTFYLTLPFKDVDSRDKNKSPKNNHHKNLKESMKDLDILIVENDEPSVLYLKILLKDKCHSMQIARTGAEAIDLIKKHSSTDLILMDVRMPDMDGYAATKKIREFNKDVQILAQTAYAMESDKIRAMEAGCNGYISKPIREEELFTLINSLFYKKNK